MKQLKPIAIHLPQFHPVPENDQWWGKGFTEWTNVTRAKPLFKGHYQPHLPADLGFYDLRLEEARVAQAELAKEYGIYGFCYYHYWFNGKRLLNRPLDDMLKTKTPDFPFMLCWANENWSRRWDGLEHEVLMKQDYNDQDDNAHFEFLCDHFFTDERYIKIDGKPFFAVYKPHLLPDFRHTVETWRKVARAKGIGEIILAGMNRDDDFEAGLSCGLDFVIDFQPNFTQVPQQEFPPIADKIKKRFGKLDSPYYNHKIVSYKKYVDHLLASSYYHEQLIPGITPGWDNSARKKVNGFIFTDVTPEAYGRWLTSVVKKHNRRQPFVFINAWNEWAEGNHLEPCQRWGRAFLDITLKVLSENQ